MNDMEDFYFFQTLAFYAQLMRAQNMILRRVIGCHVIEYDSL